METLKKHVEILKSICENNEPGKKTVQKLVYLIEKIGVKLDLDYKIHFFGPYSTKLDHLLHKLQCDDAIHINTLGKTHTIKIIDTSYYEGESLSEEEKEKVLYILEKFKEKSAIDLEGITTVDFVAESLDMVHKACDSKVVEEVKRIKGTKYSEKQLFGYLGILREHKFLN